MSMTIDSLELEVQHKSSDASNSIDSLTQSLSNLKSVAKGGVGLTTVSNQLTRIKTALGNMDNLKNISRLTTELSKLQDVRKASGLSSIFNQLKKLPEINKGLDTQQISTFAKKITELTAAVKPLATEMDKINLGFSRLPANIQRAINANAKMNKSTTNTTRSFIGFATGLMSKVYAVQRLLGVVGEWIGLSNDYQENLNLFAVAQGEYYEQSLSYAKRVQDAMGIDMSEWIRYQAVFQNMAEGFGIISSKAEIMSRNLVQMGYDLASVFNVKFDTAMEKLESALSGQPRPMREWGFDLSESSLKQISSDLGITKNVEKMSQMEKAQLRYIHLFNTMNKLKLSGDLARTIETPANALRVLVSNARLAARELGNIFIPALNKVLPYAIAFLKVIRYVATEIASFFGFEFTEVDYSGLQNAVTGLDDVADATSGIKDNTEDATKAAKELKNAVMGFDELNIIDPTADSSASGSSASAGGGPAIDLDLPDNTNWLDETLSTKADEIAENMKGPFMSVLKIVTAIGVTMGAWKIANGVKNFLTNPQTGTGLLTTVKEIWKALSSPSGSTIKLASLFGDKAAYVGTAGVISGIVATAAVAALRFGDLYTNNENFRKGLSVTWEGIKSIFGFIGNGLSEIGSKLGMTDEATRGWLMRLGAVGLLFTPAAPFALGYLIFDGITLAIEAVGYASSNALEEVDLFSEGISKTTKEKVEPFIEAMNNLESELTTLDWGNVIIKDSDVESIKGKLGEIVDTIVNELDADKNAGLSAIEPLRAIMGDGKMDEIAQAIEKSYAKQIAEVEAGESTILSIMQRAKDEGRALSEQESTEISRIRSEMKEIGIKYLSESETESNLILQRLKDNSGQLTAEMAAEQIRNALKAKEETIKSAEEQYNSIALEAQRMYDTGQITKGQYDEIITAAETAKNDTVKSAEEQYNSIVKTAKDKMGEYSKYIDTETGELKSNWEVWCTDLWEGWRDMWLDIGNTASEKWGGLKEWYSTNVSQYFTKEYWSGVFGKIAEGAEELPGKIRQKFVDMVNAGIAIFNKFFDWVNEKLEVSWKAVKIGKKEIIPAGSFKLFTISHIQEITARANGGYVSSGELFIANEAGPELIGRIGNNTAVANNMQIISGISAGVKSAIAPFANREISVFSRFFVDSNKNIADVGNAITREIKEFEGVSYNPNIDYMALINEAKALGDTDRAKELEKVRNAKIFGENLTQWEPTYEFNEALVPLTDEIDLLSEDIFANSDLAEEYYNDDINYQKDIVANLEGIRADLAEIRTNMRLSVSDATSRIVSAISQIKINIFRASSALKFASGGFPEMGQLFIAREAGPELVGKMGSKNVVANNAQIVQGVADGVYDAVVSAMSQSEPRGTDISLAVYLDGKQINASVKKVEKESGAKIATGGVISG